MRTVAALGIFLLASVAADAQTTRSLTAKSGARVVYDADARSEIVTMREEVGELRDADPGRSVQVFGDGRVVVHVPKYMKRGGDYETRISVEELDDVVRSVVDGDVPGFDATRAKAERLAAQRARRAKSSEVYEESDPSVTEISVDLRQVAPADGTAQTKAAARIQRKVRWPALARDARQFPEVKSLQGLNDARVLLGALMERGDLVRVGP